MTIKDVNKLSPSVQNGMAHDENGGLTERHVNLRGMTVWATGLFIVGEMAGGGIVAMPSAMVNSNWFGVGLIILGALLSAYTGMQLGWCWNILQDRWPEYREKTRKPYPEIADRAMGKWAKYTVSACIDATLFGVAVVFLLLCSSNIHMLLLNFTHVDVSFCVFLLAVAAVLLPVTFFGSPKDFWFIVVGAMLATTVAAILIFASCFVDNAKKTKAVTHKPIEFAGFFAAFATILFSYGGHSAFPTIQHDMKKPFKFHISILIAYVVIIIFYMPVAVAGFFVYGDDVQGNIIGNIGTTWISATVTVLITLHVLLSFVIVVNPVNLELEETLKIPHHFCWQRVVSRSVMMLSILFVAESVPHFNAVLNLMGGSTITLLTFVFPGLFYVALKRSGSQQGQSQPIRAWEIVANIFIVVVGLIGASAATYFAVKGVLFPEHGGFTAPCYVEAFLAHPHHPIANATVAPTTQAFF